MANFSLLAKLGLDSKAFQTGLDGAKGRLRKFSKSLTSLRGALATLGGLRAAKGIFNLGASAEETASKFRAVFGPATDEVNKKLKELMKTIPATEREMQDVSATMATMAEAMGLSPKLAADLSVEMVKLGGDIASFNNLKPDEVFTKLRSALSGEFEPMKQLGVVINEARIQQEALNLGIGDGTKKLSAGQKALIVYNILLSDTVKMQGDAAATADSTSNMVKFLARDLKEFGTTIGELILPQVQAFGRGLEIINDQLKKMKPPPAIKEMGLDFEEMAEANLKARGELESTKKVMSTSVGAVAVTDFAAVDRNNKKIQARADELRAAYEALSEENQKIVTGINETNAATEEGNLIRNEQREQYRINRDLINEIIKSIEGLEGESGSNLGSNLRSMKATGGISSLAAIGGGGRVGALKPLDKANDIATNQLTVLKSIERNTQPQTPGGTSFK